MENDDKHQTGEGDPEPHHALNNPVGEPHPSDDLEAEPAEAPERDKLDD